MGSRYYTDNWGAKFRARRFHRSKEMREELKQVFKLLTSVPRKANCTWRGFEKILHQKSTISDALRPNLFCFVLNLRLTLRLYPKGKHFSA